MLSLAYVQLSQVIQSAGMPTKLKLQQQISMSSAAENFTKGQIFGDITV